jgi:hypothetical protein
MEQGRLEASRSDRFRRLGHHHSVKRLEARGRFPALPPKRAGPLAFSIILFSPHGSRHFHLCTFSSPLLLRSS